MTSNHLFILLALILPNLSFSQMPVWNQRCALHPDLIHSSGITSINGGKSFWSMEDNNSPAELFEIDADCRILRRLFIQGVSKRDWEDISSDDEGNLYIGDFGNNSNNRKDLRIYIVKNPELTSSDTVGAEVISFTYVRQTAFPPPTSQLHYDMEAMVWFDDSLHLFSKNRTEPFDGMTYHYKLPAEPGQYALEPADSFKTGPGPMLFYWITGAAINRDAGQLMLLSHDRIWKFSDFEGADFFSGTVQEIQLPTYTQKEGICHATANRWFLTDEYQSLIRLGGNLYEMELPVLGQYEPDREVEFKIVPNPVREAMQFILPSASLYAPIEFSLCDWMGHEVFQFSIDQLRNSVLLPDLANGIYFVKSRSNQFRKYFSSRIIVIK
ncbi:MAG TPA: hypothetical protein VFX48_00215 [Saprospiraceae bacterium]|nr:hypothetical protein [Saprospiraceae bacterium]